MRLIFVILMEVGVVDQPNGAELQRLQTPSELKRCSILNPNLD